jgi:dCMP deaminase
MKEKHVIAYSKTALNFAECSTAQRLKVGAICVKDDKIISIGYNGTPSGWDNECEEKVGGPDTGSGTLKTKNCVIHAEANCIAKLAKSGGGSEGSIMFCTHSPCIECAKLIATSGIKKVYYITPYRNEDGINFLKDCGVDIECVNKSKITES